MTAAAIDATQKYTWISRPVKRNAPLDFEIEHQGVLIGGDCKNQREWMYSHHLELWDIFKKCLERDAVPVVITRKIPYVARLVLKKIGALGYQTHNQYFSPSRAQDLSNIRHKDELGYNDVLTINTSTPQMIRWFDKTVPTNLEKYKQSFTQSRNILHRYAIELKLADEAIRSRERTDIHKEFIDELFHGGSPDVDYETES